MARPKTKSSLVEGIAELVDSLRNIESKLNMLLRAPKSQGTGKRGRPAGSGKGPGRPAGSGAKRKPGRPAGSKRPGKRGRPPGPAKTGGKRGRPAKSRGRGRPPGSKNK